jgi:hypothetical protein
VIESAEENGTGITKGTGTARRIAFAVATGMTDWAGKREREREIKRKRDVKNTSLYL